LAQFLARREEYIEEAEIMFMFEQMLSAVSYLHDNNVLHRYTNKQRSAEKGNLGAIVDHPGSKIEKKFFENLKQITHTCFFGSKYSRNFFCYHETFY
jgi:serine/threonine protein kinase